MKSSFKYTTEVRVRYGETDQMGYCYYGNYAMYFEVGRVEAMRSLGMSYKELEESGVMLPVSHFEVDYYKPALYDDLLKVETKITGVEGPRLFFEYAIFNQSGYQLCLGKTTLVFVNKISMRPIQPPKDFLELMEKYRCDE